MTVAHVPGFPRIGPRRELKFALEKFWRGEISEADLLETGRDVRRRNWERQRDAGLDFITAGDFAWYDHVLQLLVHLGGVPARFGFRHDTLGLKEYFAMARGTQDQPAMELTKWFDTNYHYLVPEWSAETRFDGGVEWLFDEVAEAGKLGRPLKVVLPGPLTLLWLGKIRDRSGSLRHKLDLLPRLVPAYQRILARLKSLGVAWVQLDEPILALDLEACWLDSFVPTYETLAQGAPSILLASYFGPPAVSQDFLRKLPVAGIHVDLTRGAAEGLDLEAGFGDDKVVSLGVVNGRNVWRADLDAALDLLEPVRAALGDRLWVSSGCSLLHVPVDLAGEDGLDPALRSWLAFAQQKLEEIVTLRRGLDEGRKAVAAELEAARAALKSRRESKAVHDDAVRQRLKNIREEDLNRKSPYPVRAQRQQERFNLPLYPTTTIGSFPQTSEIRKARSAFKRGDIDAETYREAMRAQIRLAVTKQEALGLDVLVHGEAERNDMVEYFGEQLAGFAFTGNGWVQSYGSRCVKPPIIYGDVSRPTPMTVEWITYAQSLTTRPMKGMLTGPVTILQWSFVRDDQPRSETAMQIAAALRDEVQDLERAGIGIIQIDEPALREGLPLRQKDWDAYLDWAVRAFRYASCGVSDETQIHTHMCYSEFGDILPSIAAMDADVITIETSRSNMELLDDFGRFKYPNGIGPGVYDIHSPRVPDKAEMVALLEKAERVIPAERLWVNPDCGLKTRGWPETEAALTHMIDAARQLRARASSERTTAVA
jgi:5-methyltetrahydropteroyltriglutamate--homocysteine methyltransferase